jgi:hypothetical protein
MKVAHYLCLVNGDPELLTQEDVVTLKLMYPKLDIWNAFNSLQMEPEYLTRKEFNYAKYDTARSI